MIAAISLMRQRDDVTLATFRRHWLDVHGPLVCAFPGLRRYVQLHVIASPAMNLLARDMQIEGFPILFFDNDEDRLRAHRSPEMAACNIDSRSFIGAVSRVICEPQIVLPTLHSARMKLIVLLRGPSADEAALKHCGRWARGLPRLKGLTLYGVLQQGAAPNSTIPHLPVHVAGIAELAFDSLVDLECTAADHDDKSAAYFVVEEHRLV
jgi:uncharacterized protein (TIGR02118 family)